jgi:4-amino-4-deoxychorismate synthase (2-amino-4-deoxychorismate-forming) component I
MVAAVTQRGPLVRPIEVPPEALRQLAYADPAAFPVLLDSSALGPLGRFSLLGAYPQGALFLDTRGQLHGEGVAHLSDEEAASRPGFLRTLQRLWRSEALAAGIAPAAAFTTVCATAESTAAPPPPPPGPFHGGWMVLLGYEIAAEIEPQLQLPAALPGGVTQEGPVALALRIPAAALFDHASERAWILAEAGAERLAQDLQAALLSVAHSPSASWPRSHRPPWEAPTVESATVEPLPALELQEEPAQRYQCRIERALEYIRAGDIYQANLSRPWRGRFGEPVASRALVASLYERLRAANPAPFAALAQHRDWRLLSSSPERLVRVQAGRVETRPIAGTRPRSRRPGEDARELAALIAHPKERAEHVMLVDLERNDLGRICLAGSVRADPMMITESYAHVHHIVSNVSGQLRPGLTPIDVLRAVFPGGTITGCPKFRCMQIIAELEGEARGAYTGAIGFINHDGSMDFNILIRTLTLAGERLEFRAGGGIVADSNAQRELAETRAKAHGLLAALQTRAEM